MPTPDDIEQAVADLRRHANRERRRHSDLISNPDPGRTVGYHVGMTNLYLHTLVTATDTGARIVVADLSPHRAAGNRPVAQAVAEDGYTGPLRHRVTVHNNGHTAYLILEPERD